MVNMNQYQEILCQVAVYLLSLLIIRILNKSLRNLTKKSMKIKNQKNLKNQVMVIQQFLISLNLMKLMM